MSSSQQSVQAQSTVGRITGVQLSVPSTLTEGETATFTVTVNSDGQVKITKIVISVGIPSGSSNYTPIFVYEPPGGLYTDPSGTTTISLTVPFGLPLDIHSALNYQRQKLPNMPFAVDVYYDDGSGTTNDASATQSVDVVARTVCPEAQVFLAPASALMTGAICAAISAILIYVVPRIIVAIAASVATAKQKAIQPLQGKRPYFYAPYSVARFGLLFVTGTVYQAVINAFDRLLYDVVGRIDLRALIDILSYQDPSTYQQLNTVILTDAERRALNDFMKASLQYEIEKQYLLPNQIPSYISNIMSRARSALRNVLSDEDLQSIYNDMAKQAQAWVQTLNTGQSLAQTYEQVVSPDIASNPTLVNYLNSLTGTLNSEWSNLVNNLVQQYGQSLSSIAGKPPGQVVLSITQPYEEVTVETGTTETTQLYTVETYPPPQQQVQQQLENNALTGPESTTSGPLYEIVTVQPTEPTTTPEGTTELTPVQTGTDTVSTTAQIGSTIVDQVTYEQVWDAFLDARNSIYDALTGEGIPIDWFFEATSLSGKFVTSLLERLVTRVSITNWLSYTERILKYVVSFFEDIYDLGYYDYNYSNLMNMISNRFPWMLSDPTIQQASMDLENNLASAYNTLNGFVSKISGPTVTREALINNPRGVMKAIGKAFGSQFTVNKDNLSDLRSTTKTLRNYINAIRKDYDTINQRYSELYSQQYLQPQQPPPQPPPSEQFPIPPPEQSEIPPTTAEEAVTQATTRDIWDIIEDVLPYITSLGLTAITCFTAGAQAGLRDKLSNTTVAQLLFTNNVLQSMNSLNNYVSAQVDIDNYGSYTLINDLKVSIPIDYFIYEANALPYVKGINKIYNILYKGWWSSFAYWLGQIGIFTQFMNPVIVGAGETCVQVSVLPFIIPPVLLCGSKQGIQVQLGRWPTPPLQSCIIPATASIVANSQEVGKVYFSIPITKSVMTSVFSGQMSSNALSLSLSISGIGVANQTQQTQQVGASVAIAAMSASSSSTTQQSPYILITEVDLVSSNCTLTKTESTEIAAGQSQQIYLDGLSAPPNCGTITTFTPTIVYTLYIPLSSTTSNVSSTVTLQVDGYMVNPNVNVPEKVIDFTIPLTVELTTQSGSSTSTQPVPATITVTPSTTTAYSVMNTDLLVTLYDSSSNEVYLTVSMQSSSATIDPATCTSIGGQVNTNINMCVISNLKATGQAITINPGSRLPSQNLWDGCIQGLAAPVWGETYLITNNLRLTLCLDPSDNQIIIDIPNTGYDGTVQVTIYAVGITCQNPQPLTLPSGQSVSACVEDSGDTFVPGVPPSDQGKSANISGIVFYIDSPSIASLLQSGASLYVSLTDNSGNSVLLPLTTAVPSGLTLSCSPTTASNTIVFTSTAVTSMGYIVVDASITNNATVPLPVSFTASINNCDITNLCTYGNDPSKAVPCTQPITLSPGQPPYKLTMYIPIAEALSTCLQSQTSYSSPYSSYQLTFSALQTANLNIGVVVSGNSLGACATPLTSIPCQFMESGQYTYLPAYLPIPLPICPTTWQRPSCAIMSPSSLTNSGVPVLSPGQNAVIDCVIPQAQFPVPVVIYAVPARYSEVINILGNYQQLTQFFNGMSLRSHSVQTLNNGVGNNVVFEIPFKASTTPGTHTMVIGFLVMPVTAGVATSITAMQATASNIYLIDTATVTYQVQSTPPSTNLNACPATSTISVNPTTVSMTATPGSQATGQFTITNGSSYDLSFTCSYQDPFTGQVVNLGTANLQPMASTNYVITINVPQNATPATYNVPVTCTYSNLDTSASCGAAPSPIVVLTVQSGGTKIPPPGQSSISTYANNVNVTCTLASAGQALCPGSTATITCNVDNELGYPVSMYAVVYDASGVPVASLQQPYTAPSGYSTFNLQLGTPNVSGNFTYNVLVIPASETPPTGLSSCTNVNITYYTCTTITVTTSNANCIGQTLLSPTQQAPSAAPSPLQELTQTLPNIMTLAMLLMMITAMIRIMRSLLT